MCLYPRLIKNRKYTKTKKNKGIIPNLPLIWIDGKQVEDRRVLEVPVGCGKCLECRKQKAREWQVRLHEEIKTRSNGMFVTFTFSNEAIKELSETNRIWKLEGYNRDNAIAKVGVRRFLERWRKKYGKSLRHWFVTELGHEGTENIHLHGFVWTDKKEEVNEIWNYGYTWGGYVSEASVNYVVKYVHKVDEKHKEYKSVILTSPGIGKDYIGYNSEKNKFSDKDTREFYKLPNGQKMSLPIYYRNKLYSDDEKEKLWQNKLDEQIRYVDGIKVDISKDDELYYKILEEARKKNRRLGYGNNEKDWERMRYENERRNINFKKRLEQKIK